MAKKTKHLTRFFQAGFEGSMLGTISILIIGATYMALVSGTPSLTGDPIPQLNNVGLAKGEKIYKWRERLRD